MNALFVNHAQTIGNLIDGDHVTVVEEGLPGWAEFLALDPAPYVPPPPEPDPVPEVVSRFQALAALWDAGFLSDVQAAMANAPPIAQLAFAETNEWWRNSAMIEAMAAGLGLDNADVDDLFRAAAKIKV